MASSTVIFFSLFLNHWCAKKTRKKKTSLTMMETSVLLLTSYVTCAAACLPTARVITLSFSLTTFTTPLFCRGVTLQQSTERQCLTSSMKPSCRSGDSAMLRVRPSMTSEMFWVVPTLRGSALYLLTSSSVQSKMDVHVSWEDTPHYLTMKTSELQQLLAAKRVLSFNQRVRISFYKFFFFNGIDFISV